MNLKAYLNKNKSINNILLFFILSLFSFVMIDNSYQTSAQPFPGSNTKGDTKRYPFEITHTFTIKQYKTSLDKNGETDIRVDDFGMTTSAGDPQLPLKIYDLAVPPNIDWKTIKLSVEIQKTRTLPGKHLIKPVPPLITWIEKEEIIEWGSGKKIEHNRNILTYNVNAFYPKEPVTLLSCSQMRKWRFIRFGFIPIRYNPNTKKMILINSVKVRLSFEKIGKDLYRKDPFLADTAMDEEARERFSNFRQAIEWYQPEIDRLPPAFRTDYVIITTNAIVSGSGKLASFVKHKELLGYKVKVITENDYGILTGQAPNDTAERIREWLKTNYIRMGIKWVLFIGNPDPDDPIDPNDAVGDIPMKMCYPTKYYRPSHAWEIPTDYFYADLTGNWDLDSDGFFGEKSDNLSSIYPDTALNPSMNPESFSVRWTGKILITVADSYLFRAASSGGVRVKIDGSTVIENWTPHFSTADYSPWMNLSAGLHPVEIEFFGSNRNPQIEFWWRSPSTSSTIVPSNNLYHLQDGDYVSGGLDGEYFTNPDFTNLVFTRIDSSVYFYWGSDDRGPGGVDFSPEVYVGRIPVYPLRITVYDTLDNILQKIIDYESVKNIPPWRRNILFGTVILDSGGSNWRLGEAILNDFARDLGFGYYRCYDYDPNANPGVNAECYPILMNPPHPPNPDPTAPCNMLQEWVNCTHRPGYGVVLWIAHGSSTLVCGLLGTDQYNYLNDNQPAFVFQGSCHSSCPERSNNLGYSLLTNGAIGTIGGTRATSSNNFSTANYNGTSNEDISYYYHQKLLHGLKTGQAFYQTKDIPYPDWGGWTNLMSLNLYGDPSTSLFTTFPPTKTEINNLLDRFQTDFGNENATGCSKCFTDPCTFRGLTVSRETVRRSIQSHFNFFNITGCIIDQRNISIVNNSTARATVRTREKLAGGEVRVVYNRITLTRIDGSWYFSVFDESATPF